jgi:ABC-type transporter Mla maintaining outer membrane lipid asymmetry ATPase subunit MlaF
MINRKIRQQIENTLFKGKAIILLVTSQLGKSTILKQFNADRNGALRLIADEPDVWY